LHPHFLQSVPTRSPAADSSDSPYHQEQVAQSLGIEIQVSVKKEVVQTTCDDENQQQEFLQKVAKHVVNLRDNKQLG
jgi:hypothetical protein